MTSVNVLGSSAAERFRRVPGVVHKFRSDMLLLMMAAFCAPMSKWSFFDGLLSWTDIFFIAAFLLYVINGLSRFDRVSAVMLPLLAVSGIFIVSGMISFNIDDIYSSPINAFKAAFSVALLPMCIVLVVGQRQADMDNLLLAWVAGASFSALVALASSRNIPIFGWLDKASAMGYRAEGLAYVQNAFSYSSALGLSAAIYLITRKHDGIWLKAFIFICMVLLCYGVFASGSRASLLSLMSAVGILWLTRIRKEQLVWILIVVLVVASIIALAQAVVAESDSVFSDSFKESAIGRLLGLTRTADMADAGRWSYIEFGLDKFDQAPFFGLGWGWLRVTHMHALGILHAGGLFAFLGFLLWIGTVISSLYRIRHALLTGVLPEGYLGIYTLALAEMVIWFVNGALAPLLLDRNGSLPLGIIFILTAAAREHVACKNFDILHQ